MSMSKEQIPGRYWVPRYKRYVQAWLDPFGSLEDDEYDDVRQDSLKPIDQEAIHGQCYCRKSHSISMSHNAGFILVSQQTI